MRFSPRRRKRVRRDLRCLSVSLTANRSTLYGVTHFDSARHSFVTNLPKRRDMHDGRTFVRGDDVDQEVPGDVFAVTVGSTQGQLDPPAFQPMRDVREMPEQPLQ